MKTAGDADSEVGKKSRKRSIEKSKRPEFSKRSGMCQTLFSRNKEKRVNCSEKKKKIYKMSLFHDFVDGRF